MTQSSSCHHCHLHQVAVVATEVAVVLEIKVLYLFEKFDL